MKQKESRRIPMYYKHIAINQILLNLAIVFVVILTSAFPYFLFISQHPSSPIIFIYPRS